MAKFGVGDADRYGGGSGKFFSLKGDGDKALVRFMYNTIDDVECMAIHEIEINGRRVAVDCLREYNQPREDCPFCEAGLKQVAKVFIPIYNVDSEEPQIWERGKSYLKDLSSLCTRYKPLVATPIEIERVGAPGDTNTKYDRYPQESDETTLEDLPEALDIFNEDIVKQVSFDDMNYYLDHGKLPEAGGRNPATDRRRSASKPTGRPGRETPATSSKVGERRPASPSRPARKPQDKGSVF